MAVKKAKEASFKKMDSAFATSQSAIQKVKNTDPLNGNEEQEQGNENVSIDPAHYLSKKEKKECEETGSWRTGCLCSDYGSWIYGGVLLFLQPFSERNYDQWYRLHQQDSHEVEKEDSETAWAV